MGFTASVHAEGRRHTSLLLQLLEIERCADLGSAPEPVHGQVYRLAGQRSNTFNMGLDSRHWQVETFEGDSNKTEFTPHYGLSHFKQIPFELKKGPNDVSTSDGRFPYESHVEFCRHLFCRHRNFLQTLDEHINHFPQILTILLDTIMTLNLKKFKFFTNYFDYHGDDIHLGAWMYGHAWLTEFPDFRTQNCFVILVFGGFV